MKHECDWCGAALDREIAMLCGRCHAEHVKQIEKDVHDRWALEWATEMAIDEARGK